MIRIKNPNKRRATIKEVLRAYFIRKGLKTFLDEELEILDEDSQTGVNLRSENYFDVLRLARICLSEEEIMGSRERYDKILEKYWGVWEKKNRDREN